MDNDSKSSTEPRRFRIGKGRKVHSAGHRDAPGWSLCAAGSSRSAQNKSTTDPVGCKTCLRAIAAREQS